MMTLIFVLQTMALYQLQQKNDSLEINNLGETDILVNL